MMPPEDYREIKEVLAEHSRLIKENHRLLKKLHRNSVIELVLQTLWYALIIGLPFALYFILRPYFEVFGSSYDTFLGGLNELPGLKGIDSLLEKTRSD